MSSVIRYKELESRIAAELQSHDTAYDSTSAASSSTCANNPSSSSSSSSSPRERAPSSSSSSSQEPLLLSAEGLDRIGVLTSGGDAQGMNAAVRAVVRVALQRGVRVFAICEGYKGLIDDTIVEMRWGDVGGILQQGGTMVGTARSMEFMKPEGRKKAVWTLLRRGITKLVVIGGDGSLTGAYMLRKEWKQHVAALQEEGLLRKDQHIPHIQFVGIVGSIDNDMWGTDMTIGADSALHRIVEAVDAIGSTAASHQRSFVVQVMGRHCGWLALMAAIATGADWVLLPETPSTADDWEEQLCAKLSSSRRQGRRSTTIIVAEGAVDKHGKPISAECVKDILEKKLQHDARITILGHVQRGGTPSAFDRIMSTRIGAKAAELILEAHGEDSKCCLVGTQGSSIIVRDLMECVEQTRVAQRMIFESKHEEAMNMRGKQFKEALNTFLTFARSAPHQQLQSSDATQQKRTMKIAVMHAGAASPGMNSAVRAAVRLALDKGHRVVRVLNGFGGLLRGEDEVKDTDWMTVNGWAPLGGSLIGTSRYVPKSEQDLTQIENVVKKLELDALVVIGGYEGLETLLLFDQLGSKHPYLSSLRKVFVPATISNNMPATEYTIGSDTALNSIVEALDKIKQSASGVGRVFVVEVMGSSCGYLALQSAIATGAEIVYLPEEGVDLERLRADCESLRQRFRSKKGDLVGGAGMIIVNEKANRVYNAEVLSSIIQDEGKKEFSVRKAVLGHLQQGGQPSPIDRIRAAKMSSFAIQHLEELWLQSLNGSNNEEERQSLSFVVGEIGSETVATPLKDVPRMVDEKFRRPVKQWWLETKSTFLTLAMPFSPEMYRQ
ncbi:ATP-dependent 6-phosphofructokinase, liver type [Balamuthia mandrillaris]